MSPKSTEDRESILYFLKNKTTRPVNMKEIARSLNIARDEYKFLKRNLRSLVTSGDIFKTRTGFYGLVEKMNLVSGTFDAHRDGFGVCHT